MTIRYVDGGHSQKQYKLIMQDFKVLILGGVFVSTPFTLALHTLVILRELHVRHTPQLGESAM